MGAQASVKRYDYSRSNQNSADSSRNDESISDGSSSKLSSLFSGWSLSSRRDSLGSSIDGLGGSGGGCGGGEGDKRSVPSTDVRGVAVPLLSIPSVFKPKAVQPRQLDAPLLLRNPIVDYKYKKLLGKGSFSVVQKATSVHGKVGDIPADVAIKEINSKNLTPAQLQNLSFEINVLSQLHHPSIVALFYVYHLPHKLFLVMEYLKGGELLNMVSDRRAYSEGDAVIIVRQVIDAVAYIHACNVIHRDLKPENLIMQDHSRDSRIKIVDFGLCMLTEDAVQMQGGGGVAASGKLTMCGTRGYVSPEVVRECRYSTKCDMWAIGVISYILLSGNRPFSTLSFDQTLSGKYSMSGPQWRNVSDEAREFIARLLLLDDAERMSAAEALQHPWLTQVLEEEYEYGEGSFPQPGEAAEGGEAGPAGAPLRPIGSHSSGSSPGSSRRDLSENLPHFAALTVKSKFRRSYAAVVAALRFKAAGEAFRTRTEDEPVGESTSASKEAADRDLTDPALTMSEGLQVGADCSDDE